MTILPYKITTEPTELGSTVSKQIYIPQGAEGTTRRYPAPQSPTIALNVICILTSAKEATFLSWFVGWLVCMLAELRRKSYG